MNLLINKPRQLSFSFRSLVAREPKLWLFYQPYLAWSKIKLIAVGDDSEERMITSKTELVIDGFQGSANSFATVAFQMSQTRHVKLAHHLHAPIQILQAIELDIPVLLTIREPVGTVLSLVGRWPYISVTQGLKSYIGFYQKLEPHGSKYVVSPFEQTTQNLNEIIEILNHKFETQFDLVNMDRVKEARSKVTESAAEKARRVAIKEQKKLELSEAKNSQLLSEAENLYQKFESNALKQKQELTKNVQ